MFLRREDFVTCRQERVYKYQVSHYSILEAKVGNDKFPGFMFVNKGKIVISKKDMYSINKLEMGHSRNLISYNCNN